ncbi:MAG: hypothetical protein IJO32_03655 [Bacilli bacterium]|nr:hypothetical protein [Bacilli bacterium]
MELTNEQLNKVIAGNSHGMSEDAALQNENLYREKMIEKLKEEKEKLIDNNQKNNNKNK